MDDADDGPPAAFDCTVTDWDYVYGRCRDVADAVRAAAFEPDVVVALARGGWFAGRCLCDFLGLDDLTSLKMEHYVGPGETDDGPAVRYPMPEGSVAGKDVLVVDDIADTGASMRRAHEYVAAREPAAVRTATLQLLDTSAFAPDFVGERLAEWTWVVYPWNFVEDLCDLLVGVLERDGGGPAGRERLLALLERHHGLGRIELEVAQPGRLDEVLAEAVRRGLLVREGEDAWRLADAD